MTAKNDKSSMNQSYCFFVIIFLKSFFLIDSASAFSYNEENSRTYTDNASH